LKGISDTTRVAYHALAGGTMSVIQGGKFGAGFLAAGFAKFATLKLTAAGVFNMKDQSFGSVMGRTSVAAVVGGTASKLGGGKFKNGAQTAAMAHLLNQELSSGMYRGLVAQSAQARCGGNGKGCAYASIQNDPKAQQKFVDGVETVGEVSGEISKGATLLTAVVPPLAPITGPIAATTGAISISVDLAKYDWSAAGKGGTQMLISTGANILLKRVPALPKHARDQVIARGETLYNITQLEDK
jgi:hypothetical protein